MLNFEQIRSFLIFFFKVYKALIMVHNIRYLSNRLFLQNNQFGLWYLPRFHQYFSFNVEVSFIGVGNRRTQRKPSTCHKSLTNFLT